jgi:anti-anti-sigma regulatory factor
VLNIPVTSVHGTAVLTPHGILDSTTYRGLRDNIIKAALEEPIAVLVDVTDLAVPAESALAVFTSAHWLVDTWPDVPIILVCDHPAGRAAIVRNGISRYVPVFPTVAAGIDALSSGPRPPSRHRARVDLPAHLTSLARARSMVTDCLTSWSQTELIPVTKIIVTAFVENVLKHTSGGPVIRLEFDGSTVTVAVADASRLPASVRDVTNADRGLTGLLIVGALCRRWGNSPTTSGKTVWAVIGPENRL